MTNKYKYYIANWKMFGSLSSIIILKKLNSYLRKLKSKNFKIIVCLPFTLINPFFKTLKKSQLTIGAQNCHYSNDYGPFTGSVNSRMLKNAGASYVIIGHSENRFQGETDKLINKKILTSLNNNLNIIFCFGETLKQKNKNLTKKILTQQISSALKNVKNPNNIFFAYEPIWSIGTGKIPRIEELTKTILFIKNKLKKRFKNYPNLKILYGGSVNSTNIKSLNTISNLNGYLVGGASQSAKKFIDILKN